MPGPRGKNKTVEKAKDFKGAIARLFKELDRYIFMIIIALFLAMLGAIIGITAPNVLSKLTDEIQVGLFGEMNINRVKQIAIILGSMYIINAIFIFIQDILMADVSNNFAKDLRTSISKKINQLPLRYYDLHSKGDILSRVTNDVDTISQTLNQSLATLVTSITLFLGTIIMMFYTNWIMALTAISASVVGFVLMFLILGRSQKYFTARQTELGKLNGHIEEIYSSLNVVKVYNGEKKANEKFDKLNQSVYEANLKSQFLSGLMHPIMNFIGNFGYVAVCIVGAILTMNNVISFGVIVAFMIYVRLFTNPLSQIAQSFTSMQSTAAAAERQAAGGEDTNAQPFTFKGNQGHFKKGRGTDHFPGAGAGFFSFFQTGYCLYRFFRIGHAAVLYAGSGRVPAAPRAGKGGPCAVFPVPHHPGRGGSADLASVFHLHAGDQRRKRSDLCAPGADYGKTDPAGRRAHRHIPDPGGQPGQRLYPHGEPAEPVHLLPLPPYHRVFLFRAGAFVRNSSPVAGLAGPRLAEAGHTDGRAGSKRGKPVPGSRFRSAAAAVLCLGAAPAGPLGMHGHCGGGGGGNGPAPADAGRLFSAGDLYGVLHLYRQPVTLGHGAAAAPVFAGDPGHCVSGRAFVQPVY